MIPDPERLRVALVISALGCGGAERVFSRLAAFLAERGHRVSACVLHGGEVFFPLPAAVEVALCEVSGWRGARGWRRLVWLRRQLARLLPDAVVSFIEVANVYAVLAAPPGVPVIVSERTDPRWHHPRWPYGRLRDVCYRRAARVVVQSEELRGWAGARLAGDRVAVVPNPVFPISRAPAASHPPQLVGIGRLAPEKQFDHLVEAFGRLAVRFPTWRLVIFGEGRERTQLMRQVRRLGLEDRIELPGTVPDPATRLQRGDVFVLTSRYEGFPNALAEAMARGVAVVAYDCPAGPRELIRHGDDGVLVPVGDRTALEGALARLMAEESTRLRLGERAREVIKRFPAHDILSHWERLCRTVAGKG